MKKEKFLFLNYITSGLNICSFLPEAVHENVSFGLDPLVDESQRRVDAGQNVLVRQVRYLEREKENRYVYTGTRTILNALQSTM